MSPASAARRELATARLRLVAGDPSLGPAAAAFHRRNHAHLAPWDPPQPPQFHTDAYQSQRVTDGIAAFDAGTAYRWWLLASAGEVLGSVHLSQVARGAFHNAALGYALDGAHQGQGLMHEALVAVLAEAFSPRINLHRVQAAVRPENTRSVALLTRLGFAQEGLARDYLFIDGAWRDHLLLARTNASFTLPRDWPTP